MKTMRLPLGEWLPDSPDAENPGLTRAVNVYPSSAGYGPFPSLVATGTTVTGEVVGGRLFRRSDGTGVTCIGTKSDLFVVVGGTANASSLALTVGSGFSWQFEQFNQYIVAVCPGQSTYYLTNLDSDTAFSALTGSPPQARCVNRVGEFLMLGNTNDGTAAPYRIQWSAYNDPTDSWVTSLGKQSGAIDMPYEHGEVTGLAGGRYDMVFQRYAVSRIEQVGGTTVFAKRLISEKRGCVATPSIVRVGTDVFFLAHDGFCMTNGDTVAEIGSRRVNRWFLDDVDQDSIGLTQGAVDWVRKCVVWSYVPSGQTTRTRQIIFSWAENRWTTAEVETHWMVESQTDDLLVDDFETTYSNTSMDDAEVALKLLDSPEFRGGDLRFGAWVPSGSNSAESRFAGPPLEALFETGEFQPAPGKRSFVGKVRPIIENGSMNTRIAIGKREQFTGGAVTYTPYSTVGSDGGAAVRSDGRWHRAQALVPASSGWDKASGLEVEFRASGSR